MLIADIHTQINNAREALKAGDYGSCSAALDKANILIEGNTSKCKSVLPQDIKEKFSNFISCQKDIPSEFVEIVNEHFWELI